MEYAYNKRDRIEQTELLLQFAYNGVSIYDISERIGCDPSTAHRYLKEIEQRRELIEVTRGHYKLDPIESLSNIQLHPSEALTIYLALRRFIRQTGKAPDFMISAIQKVTPTLKRSALGDMLVQSTTALQQHRLASPEHTEIWQTLLRGWLENIVVRIQYLKAKAEEVTEHEIEPYLFEPMIFGDGTYLIAWSRTRNALRTFKPDRIQRAVLTTERFEQRVDLNIDNLLKHAWGIWYGVKPIRVELLFAPHVARRVMESVYLPTEEKTVLEDGSLYWEADVAGWLEILSWVRGWGPEVQVIAPHALRQRVIDDLHNIIAQYEEGN